MNTIHVLKLKRSSRVLWILERVLLLTNFHWFVKIAVFSVMVAGNITSVKGMEKHLLESENKEWNSYSILITYDNNPHDVRLKAAWGFSCLVRYKQKNILFDTGGSSTILFDNMDKLQIDLKEIDIVVLSHIHGDHTGGLAGFLKKNNQVTVYLPRSFPQSFKDGIKSYGAKVEEVYVSKEIMPGVYTTGELDRGIEEQSLIVKTSRGIVIITGCAHPGIVTIIREARKIAGEKVYLVVGGFHLSGTPTRQIKAIIPKLQDAKCRKGSSLSLHR